MKKPHEQEWKTWEDDPCRVVQFHDNMPFGKVVEVRSVETASFISAAPDMARALLNVSTCDVPGLCRECRAGMAAALRKARVLP